MNSSNNFRIIFVLLVCVAMMAQCGTWLAFNDFKEDGLGEPHRRLSDAVSLCKETQKRLAKREFLGERVTRAQQENDAICRLLMKMVELIKKRSMTRPDSTVILQ